MEEHALLHTLFDRSARVQVRLMVLCDTVSFAIPKPERVNGGICVSFKLLETKGITDCMTVFSNGG